MIASSAPNGSSIKSTSASWASARASATRWRMPPDSSCGTLVGELAQPHEVEQLERPLRALGAGRRRAASSAARRWRRPCARGAAPHPGTSTPCGRRRRSYPHVGWSSPATSESSVDLPQPEAPTTHTNSPRRTVKRDAVEGEHAARALAEALRHRCRCGRRRSVQTRRTGIRRCRPPNRIDHGHGDLDRRFAPRASKTSFSKRQVVDAGQVDRVEQSDR